MPDAENDALDQAIAGEKTAGDYDSSDLDSSSDDDSSDDSDDDDDDQQQRQQHVPAYSDEEDNGNMPLKTHNEISNFVVEKPDFVIDENTTVHRVGVIMEIIDKAIIVQSDPTMNMALDMGTLFAYGDRQVMGEVSIYDGMPLLKRKKELTNMVGFRNVWTSEQAFLLCLVQLVG